MNKRNRERLLRLASFLDRRAAGMRAYVKERTPKRAKRRSSNANNAESQP